MAGRNQSGRNQSGTCTRASENIWKTLDPGLEKRRLKLKTRHSHGGAVHDHDISHPPNNPNFIHTHTHTPDIPIALPVWVPCLIPTYI